MAEDTYNFNNETRKHSAAHVLAAAVLRLYPNVKIGIGPVTAEGFFYDFDFGHEDIKLNLSEIENIANNIVNESLPVSQYYLSKQIAHRKLAQIGQIYKLEILANIPEDEVSIYQIGNEFFDLCRGPHVHNTNQIGIIVVTTIEKVNWNEDPKRPVMYRIHGKIFDNVDAVTEYKNYIQQVKKYELYTLLSTENTNLVNTKNNLIILDEHNSNLIQRIDEKIKSMLIDEQTKFIYSNQPYHVNEYECEKQIMHIYSKKLLSHKELPVSFFTTTFVENSELGIINNVNKNQHINNKINLSIKYVFVDNIPDLEELVEEILKILETFGTKNRDLRIDLVTKDINNIIFNQIANILQKKFIEQKQIIDSKVENIQIFAAITNKLQQEWYVLKIEIFTNYEAMKFKDEKNITQACACIKYIVSKDILFR
ncbi:MAG: hypothetical protein NZZ41_05605, partial [Candidatus Dojkabacteria bacterium]|nr:hypothetical protein [Candidatus Dojkabacteria bacterium]